VEKTGVENAGVDSRGGKCRSDNGWKDGYVYEVT